MIRDARLLHGAHFNVRLAALSGHYAAMTADARTSEFEPSVDPYGSADADVLSQLDAIYRAAGPHEWNLLPYAREIASHGVRFDPNVLEASTQQVREIVEQARTRPVDGRNRDVDPKWVAMDLHQRHVVRASVISGTLEAAASSVSDLEAPVEAFPGMALRREARSGVRSVDPEACRDDVRLDLHSVLIAHARQVWSYGRIMLQPERAEPTPERSRLRRSVSRNRLSAGSARRRGTEPGPPGVAR